jgi:hypothetical protein
MMRRPSTLKMRSGRPHTIYFSPAQTRELRALAKQRHVTKTAIVKYAVDYLLERIKNGQLELPLGVSL